MATYLGLNRVCDLVMKGGITSGVVYPPAIDEIAKRAYLCGIGGTSAGAIAAALAAAAEFRRRHGDPAGFEQLKALPSEISGPGRMLALFKPDSGTKRAFNVLLRAMALKQKSGWLSRLRFYADAGWLVSTQSPLKQMVNNGMGLCTGMAVGNSSPSDDPRPLTEWLSLKIDSLADKKTAGPLTFGDLAGAPLPPGDDLRKAMVGATSIKLQFISTCLTFGRPYALPFLDRRFAFDPKEFERLFPKYVVDYLVQEGRKLAEPKPDGQPRSVPLPPNLLPLPVGDKLPVIVAVRMSLSFPFLFTPVPLHYPNFHLEKKAYEPVFFADGGITSNLPVHFFDSPFPRWPTLAINLQYCEKPGECGRANVGSDMIWMAKDYRDGILEMFHRFLASDTSLGKVLGLGGAIFRSAQVWSDNSFLVLPGYRDRVAEVWLNPDEGGMNLEMPEKTIKALVDRGRAAGEQLAERFFPAIAIEAVSNGSPPPSWDGHRWARYRSNMSALVGYLRSLRRAITHPLPGDDHLSQLLESVDSPPNYRFNHKDLPGETQRLAAVQATEELLKYIEALDALPGCVKPDDAMFRPFCDGPRPEVVLQARATMTPSK